MAIISTASGITIDFKRRAILRGGAGIFFTGEVSFRWLSTLAAAPIWAEYEELFDAIWGDDPDGGPEAPIECLRILRVRFTDRLACMGLKVATVCGRGQELIASPLPPEVGPVSRPDLNSRSSIEASGLSIPAHGSPACKLFDPAHVPVVARLPRVHVALPGARVRLAEAI